jgi:MATE family multidrug resistance protein
MILGQGAQMAMHVIDTAMVGRLGVDALAASAMGNNAAALFFFTGIAIGTTVPVLAAQAYGSGDRARLNLVLRHGLTVSFLFAITCIAVFAAVSPYILPWFGPPELARLARPYAILLIVSLLPALLVQNLRGFTEAQNRPWLPVTNILLGVGLNVFLNYGLIYGNLGLPALGLPGAALGTLIARAAMLLHYIWVLRRHQDLTPAAGAWRPAGWRSGFYNEYLRLAVPSAAMILVWIGNNVVVTALMGRLGPTVLGAHEIVRQLSSLLFTVSVAFQSATAIRVAQAAGRNDLAAVRRIAWSSVLAVAGVMALIGAAAVLGRHDVPRWFVGTQGPAGDLVVGFATQLLAVAACGVIAEGVTLACIGVFRGLGRVRIPALIYLLGAWLVGVPLAYSLGFLLDGGGPGIWSGIVGANLLTGAILLARMVRMLAKA